MEAQIIPLRPYQGWSPEELQSALEHNVERAKFYADKCDIFIAELALRGVYMNIPEGTPA